MSGPAPLFLLVLSLTACFPALSSDTDPDAVPDQETEGQADSGDTAGTGTGTPLPVPGFTVTDPARGTMTGRRRGTVRGQLDAPAETEPYTVTVGGVEAPLTDSGTFELDIEHEDGISILETIVDGEDGARGVDRRAVLSGTFSDPYAPEADGFVFQVPEAALHEMAGRAGDYFDPTTLERFIDNPVLSRSEVYCAGWCWTMWGIEMSAWDPDFSDIEAVVRPGQGFVDVQFVMHDFTMDWTGTGTVSSVSYSGGGYVQSDAMVVDMRVGLGWDGDRLDAEVLAVDVDAQGFDFAFDSFIYDAMAFFGMDPGFMVAGMMESTFESMLASQLPAVTAELIADMGFEETIPAGGLDYTLRGTINGLSTTPDGIQVHYETEFLSPVHAHSGVLGALVRPHPVPTPTRTGEQVIGAISLNLFNQMLFGIWDGGTLDMAMPVEALGLSSEAFSGLFPGVTAVEVRTTPMLPPTVRPSMSGSELATLTVGDLLFSFHDPAVDPDAPFLVIALSLRADVGLKVNGTGDGVNLVLTGVETYPSVVAPNTGLTNEALAALDASLLPVAEEVLPSMFGSMVTLPLDVIDGFHFRDVTFGSHDGDGGFVKMEATLEVD